DSDALGAIAAPRGPGAPRRQVRRRVELTICRSCVAGDPRLRCAPTTSSRSEEGQGAYLDTLARWRVRARRRIVERAVGGEAREGSVGVVALEHHRLVRPHARKIEPTMIRVEGQR